MQHLPIIVINLMALLWLHLSSKRVRGLKGAYGKGVWLNSSGFLMRAEDNLRAARISFALTVLIDIAAFSA